MQGGEVVGLGGAGRYAAGMSAATVGQAQHTADFIATLQAAGVDGEALDAARAAQQASEVAGMAWQQAHTELTGHQQVGAAYAANPGAGTKEFVMDAATGGSPQPSGPEPPATEPAPDEPGHTPADAPAAPGPPVGDTLKLAGRVELEPGETLVGSSKVAGESGTVRIASSDLDGTRALRLGIGGPGFGGRDDEAGPWRAGPDPSEETNAERKKLRDEFDRTEDRLAEIDAAARVAALRVDNATATLADLVAERDQVRARLDEIGEHDMAVNRAREREAEGEHVDPAELNPSPYCEPGEYDRLRARLHQLSDLPDPRVWKGELRPAEPGEVQALERRYEELDEADTTELFAGGYTAKLEAPAAGQLRDVLASGVAAAEETYTANNQVFDEIDRWEAVREPLRGMPREWTAEEDARWDEATAKIAAIEARAAESDFDYTVFAEGVVAGQWADVHYRVDLDDYSVGVQVAIGAAPHGSGLDISDLAGNEQAATLTPTETKALLRQVDRHLATPTPSAGAELGPATTDRAEPTRT